MKRRSFVKTSLLAASLNEIVPPNTSDSQKEKSLEFYELRVYTLKNDLQQKMVEDYFREAAIPALNRLGSQNVGVFTELKPEGQSRLFVLIPFRSLDAWLSVQDKLAADPVYTKAAETYLNAPATEPAYERIESSLLRAFTHMPTLELPEKKDRVFELRRYESSGENAGRKKIEMFNREGEIDIFKRVGLTPVFFGETLIGSNRPNLTYMLVFDDMAEHDRNWKNFGSDAEWKRISSIPEYADARIVSRINSTFLVPAAYSGI